MYKIDDGDEPIGTFYSNSTIEIKEMTLRGFISKINYIDSLLDDLLDNIAQTISPEGTKI